MASRSSAWHGDEDAHLISQPFEIEGKPVRLVAYDWRRDVEYLGEPIEEVLQVTWGDYEEIDRGWVANIELRDDGWWYVGDTDQHYPSVDDAAFAAVVAWIEYEKTLTPADYQRLFDAYTASIKERAVNPKELRLWRYRLPAGVWQIERTILNEAEANEWLRIFQRDEPNAIFHLSRNKPKGPSREELHAVGYGTLSKTTNIKLKKKLLR